MPDEKGCRVKRGGILRQAQDEKTVNALARGAGI